MSCTDKKRFPTSAHAEWALQIIRRRGTRTESGKKPTRAYPCPHCKGWHLTSEPK